MSADFLPIHLAFESLSFLEILEDLAGKTIKT